MKSWLDRKVTFLKSGNKPVPVGYPIFGDVLQWIWSARYANVVEYIRSIEDDKARQDAKLIRVPAFIAAGMFSHRNNSSLTEPSGVVSLDGDIDGATVEEIKLRHKDDPHAIVIFRSVSGKGAALMAGVDPAPQNNEEHRQAFDVVAAHFGVEVFADDQKDISRQRYLSVDPDIYINAEAEPIRVTYRKVVPIDGRRVRTEGDLIREGHQYPAAKLIAGAMVRHGFTENQVRAALHAVVGQYGENVQDPSKLDKLAEDIAARGHDPAHHYSTFVANVIKSHVTEEERRLFTAPLPDEIGGDGVPGIDAPELDPIYLSAHRDTVAGKEIIDLFRTALDICQEAPSDPDYIVEPWVVAGALVELIGKIKWAGKTTLTLHLVKAVLHGSAFLGKSCKRSPVVFLTEQPPSSFRRMLYDVGLEHEPDLHVLYWHDVMAKPWHEIVAAALTKCEETGALLMVVDTVFQFARVQDENNSTDADRAAGPLKIAASKGIAVLCVRHERKGGGDVVDAGRGSSAFSGQMDLILHLKRPEGNARPTLRTLEGIGRFPLPDTLYIELENGQYVEKGDRADVQRQEAEKAILDALPRDREGALKAKDIHKKMPEGIGKTVIDDMLKALADTRRIEREQVKAPGSPFVYWMSQDSV